MSTPVLSNTPFLLILEVTNSWKKAQTKPVSVPIAIGYAGLNIKSATEPKAIPP